MGRGQVHGRGVLGPRQLDVSRGRVVVWRGARRIGAHADIFFSFFSFSATRSFPAPHLKQSTSPARMAMAGTPTSWPVCSSPWRSVSCSTCRGRHVSVELRVACRKGNSADTSVHPRGKELFNLGRQALERSHEKASVATVQALVMVGTFIVNDNGGCLASSQHPLYDLFADAVQIPMVPNRTGPPWARQSKSPSASGCTVTVKPLASTGATSRSVERCFGSSWCVYLVERLWRPCSGRGTATHRAPLPTSP